MQRCRDTDGKINIAVVENPYIGNRTEAVAVGIGAELSAGPKILETGGLKDGLLRLGCNLKEISFVELSPEEDKEYGTWIKFGYSLAHLGRFVAANQKKGYFTIGLLANCNSLMGMIAGLQHSGGLKPLKVGLVWIDAHGDFNTPETTGSGLLGEMPVAVSAGLCLHRLRFKARLDPPLPTKYIVMTSVRDVNPFEQELIDCTEIEFLSSDDIKNNSENIEYQLKRLSGLTDIIYIQIDMDVLDPEEVPGIEFSVPGGPTSMELSAALTAMFKFPKTAAIGITTSGLENDNDKVALRAAYRLIEGAIQGLKER